MKNLIIIGHPDKRSFCYNGIMKTIERFLKQNKEETCVIDLYKENITFEFTKDKIKKYKELITWADRIYIISPVWWLDARRQWRHSLTKYLRRGLHISLHRLQNCMVIQHLY